MILCCEWPRHTYRSPANQAWRETSSRSPCWNELATTTLTIDRSQWKTLSLNACHQMFCTSFAKHRHRRLGKAPSENTGVLQFTVHFLHIKRQCWLKHTETWNEKQPILLVATFQWLWEFRIYNWGGDGFSLLLNSWRCSTSRKCFGYRAIPGLKYPVHFRGSLAQCFLSRQRSATVGLPSPFVGWFMGLAAWILPGFPQLWWSLQHPLTDPCFQLVYTT